jgi:DNA-binding CsgD family transcriptional regulator
MSRAAVAVETGAGPGVVLFDPSGVLESVDATAADHLAELADSAPARPGAVPAVVRAVASRALATGHGGPAPRARVRTETGRWLVVYATKLTGRTGTRVAVLTELAGPDGPAPPPAPPRLTGAYRLTPREREIAQLCIRGDSTAQIAARLHLSPYTVQDHLSAMFDKVGVRGRRALVARIFFDHYPLAAG